MGQVIVVGSFNVDHVWRCPQLPPPGATLAGHYRHGPGGKGFNQAIAACRAGADTAFICALGDDEGAHLAQRLAEADRLRLAARHCTHTPTGTAGIFVDGEGRNSIVIGAGANAALDPAHLDAHAGLLAQARIVLAQLESPAEAIAHAFALAQNPATLRVLNPAPANAETSPALLAQADILTPNETEFAALIRRHSALAIPAEAVADANDAVLHSHCRQLHPDGTVVITLGAAGCFVSHADPQRHGDTLPCYRVPASPANVLDTTGAGDAFNGALCASLATRPQAAFAQHIAFASHYAARATENEGAALAMPRLRSEA